MGTEPDDEGPVSPTSDSCGDATCDLIESCGVCESDCGLCSDGVATPTRETVAIGGDGDAHDPALWLHPTDSSQSLIIGTGEETEGLHVYDLQGAELQSTGLGDFDNVDLRYSFSLGGDAVTIVVSGETRFGNLFAYRVDPDARRLVLASGPIHVGIDIHGTCLYHSRANGELYAIVTSKDGEVEQWRLYDGGQGGVRGERVRELSVGSKTEGCVADDDLGALYLAEENVGIWRYGAEPGDGDARTLVDAAGGEHLAADVEGLAIYRGAEGRGYLIASSESRDEFVVYRRDGDNEYLASFTIVGGDDVDGCESTDGIDVISVPMGEEFPFGAFVAADDDNDGEGGGTNYKIVPWDLVAEATGGLSIDVGEDPRR